MAMTESNINPYPLTIRKLEDGLLYVYVRENVTEEVREHDDEEYTVYLYDETEVQIPYKSGKKISLVMPEVEVKKYKEDENGDEIEVTTLFADVISFSVGKHDNQQPFKDALLAILTGTKKGKSEREKLSGKSDNEKIKKLIKLKKSWK